MEGWQDRSAYLFSSKYFTAILLPSESSSRRLDTRGQVGSVDIGDTGDVHSGGQL